MSNAVYKGWRDENGTHVVVVRSNRKSPLRHIEYHSEDFSWGYSGSGPADLALSILAHHLGETWVNGPYIKRLRIFHKQPLCLQFHQAFKRDVISALDGNEFEISSNQVNDWLLKQEKPEV